MVGPVAENIPAVNFDALVAALESNTAYANIHSTKFPGGEIRGQILGREDWGGSREDWGNGE